MSAKQEESHAIIDKYFIAWNTGNLEMFDELLADGYINHTPSLPNHADVEGLKKIVALIRQGFPDIHYKIERIAAEGDLVAVQTYVTGTNSGTLFGKPPTGKKIAVNQIQFEQIKDGKIIQHWRVTDELLMDKQLHGQAL